MMIIGFAGVGFMAYRRKSKPALMAAWCDQQVWIEGPPSGGFLFGVDH
jgi:hypothetical protein